MRNASTYYVFQRFKLLRLDKELVLIGLELVDQRD